MAPPKRTFFVMLVSVIGFLYFLYTAYTSSLDGPFYRFSSSNKGKSPLNPRMIIFYLEPEHPENSLNASKFFFYCGRDLRHMPYVEGSYILWKSLRNTYLTEQSEEIQNQEELLTKTLGNASYSSSSLRTTGKENQLSNIYSVLGSISSKSNNSIISLRELIKNKTEEKKENSNSVPLVNNTKDNPPPLAEEKSSAIQRILPKLENVTVDYIVQGVATRSLYDSGFRVPNVELCPDFGTDLRLVILITSAPKHAEARKAIRQTWGHFQLRSDVAIAFILGRSSDGNETLVRDENNLYGDIILANFIDSYNNLTLKTTSILEWVDNYCNRAKFVLKTDDDMFINIPKLLDFVLKHWKDERKIFGKLARRWKPIRKKTSKYYVSVQQYKHPLFPDFTTGPAYLMTSDVIHDLYMGALDMTYLKLEDVFTTGIVAQEKNVQRVHVAEFLNRRLSITSCNVQKAISIHMIKPFEQYDLWKRLLDGRTKC